MNYCSKHPFEELCMTVYSSVEVVNVKLNCRRANPDSFLKVNQ